MSEKESGDARSERDRMRLERARMATERSPGTVAHRVLNAMHVEARKARAEGREIPEWHPGRTYILDAEE